MIRVISGDLGSGKTYSAVHEMVLRSRVESDRWYATNIDVKPEFETALRGRYVKVDFDTVTDFWNHVPHPVSTYLDESALHFNCHDTKFRGAREWLTYLTHLRHIGDEVIFISQNPSWLNKQIRDLTRRLTWCTSMANALGGLGLWSKHFPQVFVLNHYGGPEHKDHDGRNILLGRNWVYDLYDSYALGTARELSNLDIRLPPTIDGEIEMGGGGASKLRWLGGAVLAGGIIGAML